ncbi:Short-chain dehydrogenase involved in D-alanine esterification of teichoic acids [Thermostaphylospora chromogena]|uniref:Short-chain dehydrogenase involved in D-alanine esterification of teichoic acids n=2 Tax=Thermostaphylospora chromogena TaxID=35622 RepID=A0A1H1H929_9ACTN|nr:Short-chain dehydrogenase involved in D-alanine esterification of teichoic acids [Thermostaphylospora chromogena]
MTRSPTPESVSMLPEAENVDLAASPRFECGRTVFARVSGSPVERSVRVSLPAAAHPGPGTGGVVRIEPSQPPRQNRRSIEKVTITMKISGNTVLVAGGTSGIGRGLAIRLHEAGNRVIVAGRRRELLDELVAAHPGMDAETFDITDNTSIRRLSETVTAKHPELNVLVAMAGIMHDEKVLDPDSLEVAERTVATNLLGPIRLIHAFAPFLVTRPEAAILTVTSGLAYVPLPASPTYSATKAAVHSYTESLREQLRDTSVQVIEIVPPLTRTRLRGDATDNERAMPLDDFLSETMSLLESEPDARQILVERVKGQRFAVADGTYGQVLAMQSGRTS